MRSRRKLKSTSAASTAPPERDLSLDPSVSHQVTLGLAPLPKGAAHIKDVRPGVLCVNLERKVFVSRSAGPVKGDPHGRYTLEFWAPNLGQWLSTIVKDTYPVTEDLARVDPSIMPPDPKQAIARNRERAAHLPKFKREKPLPEAAPPDGKRVFKGKLGARTCLLDAGDGSVAGEVTQGTAKEAAAKLKRTLVSQDEATPYAYHMFTEAWRQARLEVKAAA